MGSNEVIANLFRDIGLYRPASAANDGEPSTYLPGRKAPIVHDITCRVPEQQVLLISQRNLSRADAESLKSIIEEIAGKARVLILPNNSHERSRSLAVEHWASTDTDIEERIVAARKRLQHDSEALQPCCLLGAEVVRVRVGTTIQETWIIAKNDQFPRTVGETRLRIYTDKNGWHHASSNGLSRLRQQALRSVLQELSKKEPTSSQSLED